jgi:hypothetical protein
MSSSIIIHFSGGIAENHTISMRTLGRSLQHLQSAVDRAYIDHKHGNVWKYAKMSGADYEEALFETGVAEEGGYILDFLSKKPTGKIIVNRISSVLQPAIEKAMKGGLEEASGLAEQIETKKALISEQIVNPITYTALVENPPPELSSQRYVNRSIVKEIDQIAAIIRSKRTSGDSTIELKLTGDSTHTFNLNKQVSVNFHEIVSEKKVGEPVIYLIKVIKLDFDNLNGTIHNVVSKKNCKIRFASERDFFLAKPLLGEKEPTAMIVCPLIEYGSFDLKAGDVFFIDLLENNG